MVNARRQLLKGIQNFSGQREISDPTGQAPASVSHLVVSDSVIPWSIASQAPLSMGCPRQEYWSELPFPPSGILPDPGVESRSPELQANSLPTELLEKPKHLRCRGQLLKQPRLQGPWCQMNSLKSRLPLPVTSTC